MDNLQYVVFYTNETLEARFGFKPYYKWIIFNIIQAGIKQLSAEVLNLIING